MVKDQCEERAQKAKENDDKASDISTLTTKKNKEEAKVNEAMSWCYTSSGSKRRIKKADQAVETLNKQIAAIKNLTIPQLPQDIK